MPLRFLTLNGWLCIVGLIIGTTLGWFLGTAPSVTDHQIRNHAASPAVMALSREPAAIPLSIRQRLEAVVIPGDEMGNRVRLLRLLEPQPTDTLIYLARLYGDRERPESPARDILDVVYKLWAERDSHGYLRAMRNEKAVPWFAMRELTQVLLGMPSEDAIQAMEGFSLEKKRQFRKSLFNHLLESDPARAFELMRHAPYLDEALPALRKLKETDPDRAAELVDAMPEGSNKWKAQEILAGKETPWKEAEAQTKDLMALPTDEAAKAIADLAPGHLQNSLIGKLLPKLLQEDRSKALAWVDDFDTPEARAAAERAMALYEAIGDSSKDSSVPPPPGQEGRPGPLQQLASTPEELRGYLEKFPANTHYEIVSRFINERRQNDPKAAAELILALPEGAAQYQLPRSMSQSWAQDSPADAAAFSKRLPVSPHYVEWFTDLAGQFAKADPQAAFEWAKSLETEGYRRKALETVVYSLPSSHSFDSFLNELQALPDDHTKEVALGALIKRWGRQDFQAAALMGVELGQADALELLFRDAGNQLDDASQTLSSINEAASLPIATQETLAANLASAYANTNAPQAVEWAQSLPDPRLQSVALKNSVSSWARTDAAAASRFVSENKNAAHQDHLVAGLVSGTVEIDPEAAFHWSTTIIDASLRETSLQEAVRHWRTKNPNAAKNAIEQSEQLTASERAAFLSTAP